ncbi:MAG TPA: HAD-IA family hydrolase [Planctomycetota bacterium]|nr:HAD-IA family hydrolase [Planctomycetota bacterium]
MTILHDHDLFVFDLDGTLVDSLDDIAASVNRVRRARRLEPLDRDQVRDYVGHGVRRLIERSFGPDLTPEIVAGALEDFLSDYAVNATVATRPYPGVERALAELHSGGKALAVLTNKPAAIAREILEKLDLARFFFFTGGGDTWPERKPHPRGLIEIARQAGVPIGRTVLVGDTAVDVDTARAAGASVAGVTYGFRPDEIRASRPDIIVDSLEELLSG